MAGRSWRTLKLYVFAIVCTCKGLAASTPCPDRGFEFFEQQGYVVRKVVILGFLPLSRSLAGRQQFAEFEGKPFSKAALERLRSELRENLKRSPSLFDSLVSISATGARVVNCTEAGNPNELDIEYLVFSTKAPLGNIHTIEHKELEKVHPSEALALSPTKTKLRLTPTVGYDTSQRLRLGGQLDVQMPWADTRLQLGGEGLTESTNVTVAMSGNREFDSGFFRKLTWRNAFEYAERLSDRTTLESGRALGQFSFLTKPVGRVGAVFRAGTLFEGGSQRTALPQYSLPSDLLAGTSFANWKSYAGFSLRSGRQSVAGSYGLVLGHTHDRLISYRKHIVDVLYDARWLVAPHRPLEVNARFTAGFLAKLGPTPVSEQFFGGNVEIPFMPGSDWVIRANPVMRGIPAYHLNRTSETQAPGSDQFSVLNLTVAIPVWGVPLIPDEATQDPEIRDKVQGFLKDGADGLVPVFELDDAAQKELFRTRREPFAKTTAALDARVSALSADVPASLQKQYDVCAEKAEDLAADASSITKSTPWRGFIKDDPAERGIPVIVRVCLVDLNSELKDAELTRLGNELKEHQRVIEQQVAKIDVVKARRLAEETLEFPKVVLNTVFDEMTIVSISPLAIFDVGRIGPVAAGHRSKRYSVGGGARLTLASSVSFQLGYARNVHPEPWEGNGAWFVGVQFIDLFGR